jgi:hypothetical protein
MHTQVWVLLLGINMPRVLGSLFLWQPHLSVAAAAAVVAAATLSN